MTKNAKNPMKSYENRMKIVFAQNRFMFFFDRNEIHIQAFQEIPAAKWMPRDSSSSTFHVFMKIHKCSSKIIQKMKNRDY